MADRSVRVEVRGLKELSAAFAAVDKDIPKELQHALKDVSIHVIGVAQQRMPYLRGTAQNALRPRATGRGSAGIAFPGGGPGSGKDKAGFYPWLDFGGGKAGARGITSSSPIAHKKSTGGFKRPVIKGGRYLYPAIAESKDYIADKVYEAIERVAEEHKFEVRG